MTAPSKTPIILSASRRTDIPAFYMDWFMQAIREGGFEVTNPYNRHVSRVPASPEAVHSIVFWSKDFRPFLDGSYGETLNRMGYHLFFNFTINSASEWLEPGIPPLDERLATLSRLCAAFGPESVNWRFDPICFYTLPDGTPAHNLADFPKIAEAAGRLGIRRCITSFMDHYPKIKKRLVKIPGFAFQEPPLEKKTALLERMAACLKALGISLLTCCEKEVMAELAPDSEIRPSACISGALLKSLFGGNVSLRRDSGQRLKQGCGCSISSDIGSYKDQPCSHNCLFCYANPSLKPPAFSQTDLSDTA
ncbi:MAG: DUF1848 domain-containing protein [Thermodesulfobacteriota bacterium]